MPIRHPLAAPLERSEALDPAPYIAVPSPGFSHGTWRELSGSCFSGPIRLSSLQVLERQQDDLVTRYPAGIGTVNIIRLNSSMKRLDQQERALSEKMVRKFGSSMRANATIIFGTGFSAAAARSIMTAQRFVSRAHYPDGTFSALPAAIAWMVRQLQYSEADSAAALRFLEMLFEACPPMVP